MVKNLFKLTLGITMMVSILIGCSSDTTNETAEEDEAYTIATVRWAEWGDSFLKGFVEETEQEADISINWDVYVNSEWGDKKSVVMAGGELPDAFWGSLALTDSDIAKNQGVFIPLEDLIEEHMPNLTKAFEEDPTMRAMVTSPDGHIYSLPKKLPLRPIAGNSLFINQQWLDHLGLEMPQTYEELYDVLKAFKEEDANNNGDPNDEIPAQVGVLQFILPFGLPIGAYDTNLTVQDGKPVYIPTAEAYREGIEWMHQAYAEGLIDQELFTQDTSMAEAKRQNDEQALVGLGTGWTADAVFGPNANQYAQLPALEGPDGERYVMTDAPIYERNEFMITTEAKNPEKLLQWADQFYTEDASIQTFYGSYDIAVEKHDDGTYEVLEAPDGESADIFAWTNSFRDFGPKYVGEDFNEKVTLPTSGGDGLKLELDQELNPYVREQFPNVIYTEEESARLSTLTVDLEAYVESMQSKWVVEGGATEEWDAYISQLEQMGLGEYMDIQNEAFDRYQESLSE
ncbi:type 2 periplasmic-binding domain-containing protein [Gracilibacillus alcaliphilus]|uniref:extracellular solute-binding protein n=1 Tax=Gracilibacillus alcaliphilus TaxID=1401441 RepID=UPI001957F5DE|nr:extracellular solute-binding protein [Gracilibacillus alcaliphilus]MBM7675565.1 putative aldouronate transport system substrate-binding protein [Gracilibacillus alcaliphilus]